MAATETLATKVEATAATTEKVVAVETMATKSTIQKKKTAVVAMMTVERKTETTVAKKIPGYCKETGLLIAAGAGAVSTTVI